MDDAAAKAHLHGSLQQAREAVLWKLDGLGEYDARRPLTPTGTNLLGLLKHLAFVEAGYFADAFDRPMTEGPRWDDLGDDETADMWATADESRDELVATYRRTIAHADGTITELPLDAEGHVAHWPAERNPVTLHAMLVHVVAETQRHAGHVDIVRELIDGAAGRQPGNDNLAPGDADAWARHRGRVERAAREAAGRP
ncbi:DinB family protein [Actinomycetospora chlora]|uniref:DinB family protein n=1 Tax=Actinomycetospora chlora TaxID=663608 RepID=A0ABP9BWL7_9PSEU